MLLSIIPSSNCQCYICYDTNIHSEDVYSYLYDSIDEIDYLVIKANFTGLPLIQMKGGLENAN